MIKYINIYIGRIVQKKLYIYLFYAYKSVLSKCVSNKNTYSKVVKIK